MNNKGLKFDNDKPQWNLLPLKLLLGIIKVLMFGAKKYSPNSWQKLENGKQRYFNALIRYITAMQNETGEIDLNAIDSESKLPHLWHIQTNAIFLEKFRQQNELGERNE